MELEFEIPILVVLIGLSGFFSGLEVALVGTRLSKIEQMVKDKVKGSSSLLKLKTNPSRMMASVNLGNNLVNVAATAIATDVALKLFGNDGLAIAIGIMTFLILVFGEITPKTYCNANASKIAVRYSRVLLGFSYTFYPIVRILEGITKGIIKLTGSSDNPPGLTEDEIKGVIDQGLKDKAIKSKDIARAFKESTNSYFGNGYADLINQLNIESIRCSTSLPRGNQVDGLPRVLHFGVATIGKFWHVFVGF